jgi:hypothetical protein
VKGDAVNLEGGFSIQEFVNIANVKPKLSVQRDTRCTLVVDENTEDGCRVPYHFVDLEEFRETVKGHARHTGFRQFTLGLAWVCVDYVGHL